MNAGHSVIGYYNRTRSESAIRSSTKGMKFLKRREAVFAKRRIRSSRW